MSGLEHSNHSRIKSLNIGEILSLAADNKKLPKSFKITQKFDKPRHISPDLSTNCRNSNPSQRNSPERITISSIRSRKNPKNQEISPNLAIEVVKDYLIPLFKLDKKKKQDQYRAETYNSRVSPPNIKSEILLSEQIYEEKKELEKKFNDLEKAFKEVMQDKILIEKELQNMNEKYLNLESEYKILEYNSNVKQCYFNVVEQKSLFITSQIEKLKNLVSSMESDNKNLSAMVNQEKYVNDIRFFSIFFLTFKTCKIIGLRKSSILTHCC